MAPGRATRQAADVGVGIVGKEGVQASLAADFSVLRFSALRRLVLWHGRALRAARTERPVCLFCLCGECSPECWIF